VSSSTCLLLADEDFQAIGQLRIHTETETDEMMARKARALVSVIRSNADNPFLVVSDPAFQLLPAVYGTESILVRIRSCQALREHSAFSSLFHTPPALPEVIFLKKLEELERASSGTTGCALILLSESALQSVAELGGEERREPAQVRTEEKDERAGPERTIELEDDEIGEPEAEEQSREPDGQGEGEDGAEEGGEEEDGTEEGEGEEGGEEEDGTEEGEGEEEDGTEQGAGEKEEGTEEGAREEADGTEEESGEGKEIQTGTRKKKRNTHIPRPFTAAEELAMDLEEYRMAYRNWSIFMCCCVVPATILWYIAWVSVDGADTHRSEQGPYLPPLLFGYIAPLIVCACCWSCPLCLYVAFLCRWQRRWERQRRKDSDKDITRVLFELPHPFKQVIITPPVTNTSPSA